MILRVVAEVVASRRGPHSTEAWAAQRRYTVEKMSRRWLSWRGERTKRVYEVLMRDVEGEQTDGTAAVSGGIGGVAADVVEVRCRS